MPEVISRAEIKGKNQVVYESHKLKLGDFECSSFLNLAKVFQKPSSLFNEQNNTLLLCYSLFNF